MNIDTEVIRAETHVEIGSLLQRNAHVIIDRWCALARDEPKAQRVHYEVLRDELDDGIGTQTADANEVPAQCLVITQVFVGKP
jgi:hypothetical protein